MTDEQIIKALETHLSDEGECSECAYLENVGSCVEIMHKDLYDLINRQKTKNNQLDETIQQLAEEINRQNAEIERLQHNNTRREANFLYLQKTLAEKNAKIKALQMDNAQIQSDNINANMNHEHLQAEIESLDFLIKESNKIAERQDKEIERLQAHNSSMQSTLVKMSMGVEEAKAEAIKEFAERLHSKAFHDVNDGEAIVCCCDIDNLVKEMVGDAE